MSITDELRRWVEDRAFVMGESGFARRIADFCDRIDAEHEAKVAYWQGASYKDGYDEGFASADDWLAQHEDAMAEHGWVRLPKDADGETWHIGDRTESGQTVKTMGLYERGWYFSGIVNEIDPALHRHYRKPTVEDVLHEMIDEWVMADSTEDEEAVVVECAKKLRLKEEA